ncbi:MAG: hypothetical protein KGI06_03795 [Candidatus Micrarchaeota archaeon]|nr:hypothetical protein [Candidatus Micrarchaeota archaeon]
MENKSKPLAEPSDEDVELLLWGLENKDLIRKNDRTLALLLDVIEKRMMDAQKML